MNPLPDQPELAFGSSANELGYKNWWQPRREAMTQLASQRNLPLGHSVEVWLRGGIRLRGTLRLCEEILFVRNDQHGLQLTGDGVKFNEGEMESWVRRG